MPRLNDAVALLFCLFAASWLFVAAQPRAKTTYVAAGVCCSPVKAPKTITKTVKKTATVKQTVLIKKTTTLTGTVGPAVRRRLVPDVAENTRIGELSHDSITLARRKVEEFSEEVEYSEPLDELGEALRSGLFKRHLCPVSCPKGVKVLASSDAKHNTGGSVVYCCPVRKTLTKTITQKSTKKVTVKKTTTIKVTKSVKQTATTTKPNRVVAIVFSDVNGNGNNGPGDTPLPNVPVDLIISPPIARQRRSLCTVLATGITGPDGTVSFDFDLVSSNAQLCIVKHGECTNCLVQLTADANGQVVTNGTVQIPVPVSSSTSTVSGTNTRTATKSGTQTQPAALTTLKTTSKLPTTTAGPTTNVAGPTTTQQGRTSTSATQTTSCAPPAGQFQADAWPLYASGNGQSGLEWLSVTGQTYVGELLWYAGTYRGAGVKVGSVTLPDSGTRKAGVAVAITCDSIVQWALTSFGADGDTAFTGITTDMSSPGYPVIVGWTEATSITVGNETMAKGVGQRDSFIVALDSATTVKRLVKIPGSAAGDLVTAGSVVVSGFGNYFVYGSWKAPAGITLAGTLRATFGGVDCFVAKYDTSTPGWDWARTFGSSEADICASKIVLAEDDCKVAVGGGFKGPELDIDVTLSGGPAAVDRNNSEPGSLDAFVVAFHTSIGDGGPAGDVSHVRQIGGSSAGASDQVVTAIVYDSVASSFWIGGYFNQSIGNTGISFTANSRSDYDMFAGKLNYNAENLTTQWFDSVGGHGDDRVFAMAFDTNYIVFAGTYSSALFSNPGNSYTDVPLFPGTVDDAQSFLMTVVINKTLSYPTDPTFIGSISAGEFADQVPKPGEFNKFNDLFSYYELYPPVSPAHAYPIFFAGSTQTSYDPCMSVNMVNSGYAINGTRTSDLYAFRLDYDTGTGTMSPPASGLCPVGP